MQARNSRLLVEYDGTPYAGWQVQTNQLTVQGELQRALQAVVHEPEINLFCAGRTDAGVHALAQTVSFFSHFAGEARRLTPALNHYLPATIRVHRAEDAPPTFNARRSALGKRYRYRVYHGPHAPALDRHRAWHVRRPIDMEAMRLAAVDLLGERDFESFRSVHCDASHAIRQLHSITFDRTPRPPAGEFYDITFHANAYCRHMCRILAGTLIEVGTHRRAVVDVARILQARDRRQGGVTAPPWGLTLIEVFY